MATLRKKTKDRTSVVIAVVFHAVLIGGVVFWAYKSGKLEQMRQAVLQYVRSDKKSSQEPAKPIQQKNAAPAKLPPINQGMPPSSSTGTRRAVAVDAPAAAGGESFFQDTRAQAEGSSRAAAQKKEEVAKTWSVPAKPHLADRPRTSLRSTGSSNVKALLQERSKAAASIESFGAEQIGKSSVSDAADIVARVSGATVVEGKYAVIRGLTERYSAATLNGAELPSADPYRRSASLDMFPAKIIDRVTVTKTFTPDQPGSYTGGNINIITRSFPDRPFAVLELGGGYNTQTTGNEDFLTYSGGSMDWLGLDDGTRALASEFWNFDQLVVPQYRSQLGRPLDLTSTRPSTTQAIQDAAELERLTELAGPAEFAPSRQAPPPAHSFVAAAGDTTYLFGRPVGLFLSLPYSHNYAYYSGGQVTRVTYGEAQDSLEVRKTFTEEKGVQEVNWAGTASLAYQLFPDHQLAYNFIFNQFSEDSARIRLGEDLPNDLTELTQYRLQFIERNLTSHQFRGDHLIPALGQLKVDWLATFTDTEQMEPDTRFFYANAGSWDLSGLEPKYPTRYWRETTESGRNLRTDFTLPLLLNKSQPAEVKWGLFSSAAERDYRERILQYSTPTAQIQDPNNLLTQGNLGSGPILTNGTFITYTWSNYLHVPSDYSWYTAESEVPAGYAMLDLPLTGKVRLIGGARFEHTEISTTSFTTVPSEGVEPNTTNSPPPLVQDDLLPAAGFVWAMRSDMNVRLNYGETVTRPSFRELAGIRTYDPVLDEFIVGNPDLRMSAIRNYDARWEWFPRPGEVISVGLFYKDLKLPIEKEFKSATGDIVTFVNRPEGEVYGVEFEGRKVLDFLSCHLRDWSLGGNVSLLHSEQPVSELQRLNHTRPELLGDSRPLADQSPYIVNLDLTYENPSWGTTMSLAYSVFGPRLTIANLTGPDVYEQPVHQLDLVLSQRIGRNLRVKFTARNLLDPVIERTYGEDAEAIYQSYTRGRTFSLSLSYEF